MEDVADMTGPMPGTGPAHAAGLATPPDTSHEAQRVRLDILRRMPFAQKAEHMSDLSETLRDSMIAGVRFRHPEYTRDEARWAVVCHLLGDDLFSAAFPDAPHRPL